MTSEFNIFVAPLVTRPVPSTDGLLPPEAGAVFGLFFGKCKV